MSRLRVGRWLAFLLGVLSAPAMADPENPFLTPENPTAQDTVFVNVHAGPCDLLQHTFAQPEVTRDGDQIIALFSGEHIIDPMWCTLGTRIESVSIGSFPPGTYAVTIIWEYFDQVEDVQVTLGVLPLTIDTGSVDGPVALPTFNGLGLWMLVLLLSGTAVLHVRRLPSNSSQPK